MRVIAEFSRHADSYGSYNIIQKEVAKALLDMVTWEYRNVLDLGCGSGTLYRFLQKDLPLYIGVDQSLKMLDLHPQGSGIELIQQSFDDPALFSSDLLERVDTIFSSSALQWSQNLEALFTQIAASGKKIALALFTSGTFQSIQAFSGVDSPLLSAQKVDALAQRCFNDVLIETKHYQLTFQNSRELFQYIKKSGVSGNRNRLSYQESRHMIENFSNLTLDFEVLFICSK